MGIRKQHALGRQPVHLWRLGLRVAFQHVRPVIQVIDGDEEDIGFLVLRCRRDAGAESPAEEK